MRQHPTDYLFSIDDQGPASTPEGLDALIAWANGAFLRKRMGSSAESSARLGNEPLENPDDGDSSNDGAGGSEWNYTSPDEANITEVINKHLLDTPDDMSDMTAWNDWYSVLLDVNDNIVVEEDEVEEDACIKPFDPPAPFVAYNTRSSQRKCQNAVDDISENQPSCPAPVIDCGPEFCTDDIVDTNSSSSLNITFANNVSVSQGEIDLIHAAWNMLEDNIDIVEWVACLLYGRTHAACVIDVLQSEDPSQEIRFWDPKKEIGLMRTTINLFGRDKIKINIGHIAYPDFISYVGLQEDSGFLEERACYVAHAASVIMHELMHVCRLFESSDEPYDCYKSYMAQTAFLWAMGNRHPCLSAGSNNECAHLIDDCMWMNDGFELYRLPTGCGTKQVDLSDLDPEDIRDLSEPDINQEL